MKLTVGIITYEANSAKYLPFFLKSLKEQTFKDFELVVFDNSEMDVEINDKIIKEYYPNVIPQGLGKNIGFSRAYNFLIREAFDKKSDYFLVINCDLILEKDAIEKMVKAIDETKELGSVCPKLKFWDFKNNRKTDVIDSCGLKLRPGLRFFEIGQGEVDNGQFDGAEILGPSGAAALYRMSALDKIKKNADFFEELIFMYKEDCDLAYRLHLAGYKSKNISDAVGYHDRTARGMGESDLRIALNRKNKSQEVKKWSFLSQQIIFYKFWHLQSFKNKMAILFFQIKMIAFAVIFEQYLLGQFVEMNKIKRKIKGEY